MNDKRHLEIQITQNDYCTLNFVDGISMKLNVGDKIVIEVSKSVNDKSILWPEEYDFDVGHQPNRWFQNSNRCFLPITEKLFNEECIELHGISLATGSLNKEYRDNEITNQSIGALEYDTEKKQKDNKHESKRI